MDFKKQKNEGNEETIKMTEKGKKKKKKKINLF